MKAITIVILIAAMASMVSAVQLDQTFHADHDFTIHLPDGWIEVPKAEIDRKMAAIRSQYPNAPLELFEYAYQLDSSGHWLEYPYIAIQVRHTGKLTQVRQLSS